jgi:hypothetical protein
VTSTEKIFGWRHWVLQDDLSLTSPLKAHKDVGWKGATIYCRCTHGYPPPSPKCLCGIYFIDDAPAFFLDNAAWAGFREFAQTSPELLPWVKNVVTYGHSVGKTDIDPNCQATWGSEARGERRAAGYRIVGFLFAGESWRNSGLAESFGVPYRIGINLDAAQELQAAVSTGGL